MKCVQTFCISIYLLMSSSKFLTDELFKESWKKIQLKVNSLSSLQPEKRDFFYTDFCFNACSKKARKSEGKTVY